MDGEAPRGMRSALARAAAAAVGAVLDAVYPRRCAVCGEGLDEPEYPHICGACLQRVRWIENPCRRCAMPLGPWADEHDGRWCAYCRTIRLSFDRSAAACAYEEPVKPLVLAFKYGRRMHLGALLGEMLARRALAGLSDEGLKLVVPVPLHPARLSERGFNQAELLAERAAKALGIPLVRALRRVRYTPAQAARSRTARFENLRGAFECTRPAEVSGRSVLLVDDVMTTGATCSWAARALKAAGAASVAVAVVARTLGG